MALINHANHPGTDLVPVVPDDDNDLETPGRSLRCRGDGTSGAVSFVSAKGETRDTYIDAGETIPVQVVRVRSTGTAATKLEVVV